MRPSKEYNKTQYGETETKVLKGKFLAYLSSSRLITGLLETFQWVDTRGFLDTGGGGLYAKGITFNTSASYGAADPEAGTKLEVVVEAKGALEEVSFPAPSLSQSDSWRLFR